MLPGKFYAHACLDLGLIGYNEEGARSWLSGSEVVERAQGWW